MLGGQRSLGQLKRNRVKVKNFKILLVFFLVVILGLLACIYFYNMPHVNVIKSEAAYTLTAQNLIDQYQEDEATTNAKYTENVIQIVGTIFDISTLKGNMVITLKDDDLEASIICHMLPEENRKSLQLKKGQNVNIKGICTGYLLDVIMVKCTLVE